MNDVSIAVFKAAIKNMHDADARLRDNTRVVETFEGETVWEGEVLVFELEGHPTAQRCYAWEVDGEVTAVLEEGPVKSARDAVRAAIMADETQPAEGW